MNDVKEPKAVMTVEEAFELTKKALLFTISDNEGKTSFNEALGVEHILGNEKRSKLILSAMIASSKSEVVKIVLENSNSLGELVMLLYATIDTMNDISEKFKDLGILPNDEE